MTERRKLLWCTYTSFLEDQNRSSFMPRMGGDACCLALGQVFNQGRRIRRGQRQKRSPQENRGGRPVPYIRPPRMYPSRNLRIDVRKPSRWHEGNLQGRQHSSKSVLIRTGPSVFSEYKLGPFTAGTFRNPARKVHRYLNSLFPD